MGLIKAGMGALGGTLADQWKEFFYCDSLDKDVLMVKGQKRTSRRSSNNGEDNIITNGSGIAVADGQCMLIVEQGRGFRPAIQKHGSQIPYMRSLKRTKQGERPCHERGHKGDGRLS